MEDRENNGSSHDQERDVLEILMDSNLYLELSLHERLMLLKHVIESYRAYAVTASRT